MMHVYNNQIILGIHKGDQLKGTFCDSVRHANTLSVAKQHICANI